VEVRIVSSTRAGLAILAATAVAASAFACTSSGAGPRGTASASTSPATPKASQTAWPSVIALPTAFPSSPTFEQLRPLFAYQGDRPFSMAVAGTEDEDGATVQDISYVGAAGQTLEAYLVVPSGTGPFPAILYEHGGNAESRETFHSEAVLMSRNDHVVALVVTRDRPSGGDDLTAMILQSREARRAFDLLQSLPFVDGDRLGYVGYSWGAVMGVPLLSVEDRVKAAVLMCVVPAYGVPPFDAYEFAPNARYGVVFLQFGRGDPYYTQDEANGFAAQMPNAERVTWYDADHGLNNNAYLDREAWLVEQLGLS
jgi:dienelactone hydrolase